MGDPDRGPGFFGKVPGHGDFVGRRLPPAVRDSVDRWLQESILHSRRVLGTAWTATWSTSPLWRFVLGAGVCGDEAWAGIMMPSADRVGRCFPLLLMAPCHDSQPLSDYTNLYASWFMELEEIALSMLDNFTSLDSLDKRLSALGGVPTSKQPATESLREQSAWWRASTSIAPELATCRGLPSPSAFMALLNGEWPGRAG